MPQRNFPARFVVIFSVVILLFGAVQFSHNATATQTAVGYCGSGPDHSSVYVSEIFNTGFSISGGFDSTPIQNEYTEYLKGRFDFKSTSTYTVACPLFENMGQAQSSKR